MKQVLLARDWPDAAAFVADRGWQMTKTIIVTKPSHLALTRGLIASVFSTPSATLNPDFQLLLAGVSPCSATLTRTPIVASAETSPSSCPPARLPLTALGGVQLPSPPSDAYLPQDLAAAASIRRLQIAAERFRDAEQALRDGVAALELISPYTPQRKFAEAQFERLARASTEVAGVLDSMHQVGVIAHERRA